jgi:hypothetical protein
VKLEEVQSMRRRRIILACLALVGGLASALVGVGALLPQTPLEAVRRRVSLGADENAVVALVGRPADHAGELGRRLAVANCRMSIWVTEDERLQVEFDAAGRSIDAYVYRRSGPTFWDRARAWLGF